MADETLEGWLDQQIEYAENAVGMHRSYGDRRSLHAEHARANLATLKLVRQKMVELWGAPLPAKDASRTRRD